MKRIYFAGKFNKIDDNNLSLEQKLKYDYRSILLESPKYLTYYQKDLILNNRYIYSGPFYCEEASSGDFTSTDCNEVLNKEYEAIKKSDIVFIVFNDSFSVGSIVELSWAINNKKEIILLYEEDDSIYNIKSEYWFAILDAQNRAHKIKILQYNKNQDLNKLINQVLNDI